jgi:hypothetical protein
MERRAQQFSPAEKVAAALDARGIDAATLSEATDIPLPVLRSALADPSVWTMDQLGRVGGFLRIHPIELIGVA